MAAALVTFFFIRKDISRRKGLIFNIRMGPPDDFIRIGAARDDSTHDD
jgi:hypothetical protein